MYTLPNSQVRKDKILGNRNEGQCGNLRVGSKTLSQVYGLQGILKSAIQSEELLVLEVGLKVDNILFSSIQLII